MRFQAVTQEFRENRRHHYEPLPVQNYYHHHQAIYNIKGFHPYFQLHPQMHIYLICSLTQWNFILYFVWLPTPDCFLVKNDLHLRYAFVTTCVFFQGFLLQKLGSYSVFIIDPVYETCHVDQLCAHFVQTISCSIIKLRNCDWYR